VNPDNTRGHCVALFGRAAHLRTVVCARGNDHFKALPPFLQADQVALFTGVGGGIGRATARAFAEAGASVIVANRAAADRDGR
jgi:hypothetical protein